jgi:mannose-6-phosphate isomerase
MRRPLVLPVNPVPRFYRGGARIASFRGLTGDVGAPEDWVGSATTAHGEASLGATQIEGRGSLRDLMIEDPEGFFGPAHAAAYGGDPRLLVKLLDAGQRLPVHFHPDDAFARAHLSASSGKTEAWLILDAAPGACVHVGFARDVAPDELHDWFASQDIDAMLAAMTRVPVEPADAIFVPAGIPHVIGEGILLLELQQPSDLSLLLEWEDVVPESSAFLGLAPEVALPAARRAAVTAAELDRLRACRDAVLFPPEADPFFRADRLAGGAQLEQGFAILVALAGEGELVPENAPRISLARGATVLVPYAAGPCLLEGHLEVVRTRPPETGVTPHRTDRSGA